MTKIVLYERDYVEAQARIAELERWKAEAMAVLNEVDLQEIGKELNIPLGHSIAASILPSIKELKQKLAEQQALYANQEIVGYVREYGIECLQGTLIDEVTGRIPLPSRTTIDPYKVTAADIPLYAKPTMEAKEELNKLLAAAKEEGRKEAVPEAPRFAVRITLSFEDRHWSELVSLTELNNCNRGGEKLISDIAAKGYTMLASAPKPQGE